MIEKLISQFTRHMKIEQFFDDKEFTLTVRTWYGSKLINEHVSDMEPLFKAFEKRLDKSPPIPMGRRT